MLDYDGNMVFLKVNRHLTLLRIQHYNHPGLQGIPLHRCKYSLKVRSLLSCAELQNKAGSRLSRHSLFKSGDWHVILTLHGFTLTCCYILAYLLLF